MKKRNTTMTRIKKTTCEELRRQARAAGITMVDYLQMIIERPEKQQVTS